MNVLFLCTGSFCRFLFAGALFRQIAPQEAAAQNAGSTPPLLAVSLKLCNGALPLWRIRPLLH